MSELYIRILPTILLISATLLGCKDNNLSPDPDSANIPGAVHYATSKCLGHSTGWNDLFQTIEIMNR